MSTTRAMGAAGALLLAAAVACAASPSPGPAAAPVAASSTPPAASTPAPTADNLATPVASSAAPVETEPAPSMAASTVDPAGAEDPEAEAPTAESVSPSQALTAPGVAFMLDDPGSGLAQKLNEMCVKKLPKEKNEDPAELAKCRLELRDKFKADVFVFRNEGGGLKWIVYQRKGSALPEIYSARVKLADETPTSFKIRPISGQGARPVFKARADVPVDMPSKTELVLEDPEYGKLVYRAKTGLVGN